MTASAMTPSRPNPAALRAPDMVLRLERMGSFHQTRLSFMRVLLRRLVRENWQVVRTLWDIDAKGKGVAVYEARGNGRVYSLVAFGHELDPAKRTDRVIAEEWDATFVLHDGVASQSDIDRLAGNVPKQEAGRCSAAELVMARANRSVRLFDHVVARLAEGRQPEAAELDAVGYLMRTTAVYGSGKFGLADREKIADRTEVSGPFAAEMLTVWLIRAFTTDLVEHLANLKSPGNAVRLERDLRRRLGVGNSTGLGMAPFVVNHPGLFHRWISARETALSRVRAVEQASAQEIAIFRDRLARAMQQMAAWQVEDTVQARRIDGLRRDLDRLITAADAADLSAAFAWDRLFSYAETELGLEAQELLVTLLLEPYGALVDELSETMAGDETADFAVDGAMTLAELAAAIAADYGYALAIDFSRPAAQARFWYVSEEKLEPRLGERALEEGGERELPLAVARDVAALHDALKVEAPAVTVAEFLSHRPEFRHAVRRIQLTARRHYAEIRDNLTSADLRPIDILRCKLSFFGATDFDPRSDRWVRVALFRHAPFPDELALVAPDDWAIPPLAASRPLEPGEVHRAIAATSQVQPTVPDGYSFNEIDAEIRKAARGAGLSWGLAEDAGRMVRPLARFVPQHLGLLADVLEKLQHGHHAAVVISDATGVRSPDHRPLSPLVAGPVISDRIHDIKAGLLAIASPVAMPALLAPVLTGIAGRLDRIILLRMNGCEIAIGADMVQTFAALSAHAVMQGTLLPLRPLPRKSGQTNGIGGVVIADAVWRRFNALAALTYVPASEHSRLSGAGAGLNDND